MKFRVGKKEKGLRWPYRGKIALYKNLYNING